MQELLRRVPIGMIWYNCLGSFSGGFRWDRHCLKILSSAYEIHVTLA